MTQDKTYNFFKRTAIILSIIFAVLALDKLLSLMTESLLNFSFHQYEWPFVLMQIYRAFVAGSLIGGLACWIIVLVLWLIRYICRQKSLDEQLSSHLIGVTPEQEQQILRLLKRAAKPSDGSNKMNRSEVATLLATLKEMNLLEDAGDYNNLRLWVVNVTGLKDDDKVHFNEQYKRALKKEIDPRYEAELKKILEK